MASVPVSVAFLLTTLPVVAQTGTNGLEVRPDPQNVVASSLLGSWKRDAALQQRLGNKTGVEQLEFRDDATIVAKVPEAIAAKLRVHRIYLAGVMVLRGKEQPFLLTELAGNPTVVWFRERGGDPLGDAESFTVMLARAEAKPEDLLFVGGDFNNQSFSAYTRVSKVVGKLDPVAAIADMIALLEAGKSREFVETYCAPEDLAAIVQGGRTIEKVAARFEGERAQAMVEFLQTVSKLPPTMNAAGDEASWTVEKKPGSRLPGALRLQCIDGRWYMRDR
jgi:hypothetical protein